MELGPLSFVLKLRVIWGILSIVLSSWFLFNLKINTNYCFLTKISPAHVFKRPIVCLEKRIILKDDKLSIL